MPIVNKVAFKNKAVIKNEAILKNNVKATLLSCSTLLCSLLMFSVAGAYANTTTANAINTKSTSTITSQTTAPIKAKGSLANTNNITENDVNQYLATRFSAKDYQEYIVQYNKALKEYGTRYDALSMMRDHFFEYDYDTDHITDKKLLAKIELWYLEINRFDSCRGDIIKTLVLARKFYVLHNNGEISKEELFKSQAREFGVDYPFSQEDANSASVVTQLSLKKAWQYKDNNEAVVNDFFLTCLKQQLSVF